jgi:hypothetical protein
MCHMALSGHIYHAFFKAACLSRSVFASYSSYRQQLIAANSDSRLILRVFFLRYCGGVLLQGVRLLCLH